MPLAMSVICPSRSSVAFFAPLGRPLLCRVQTVREFKLPGSPQQDHSKPQKVLRNHQKLTAIFGIRREPSTVPVSQILHNAVFSSPKIRFRQGPSVPLAQTYIQLPLHQWGAGNVYLLDSFPLCLFDFPFIYQLYPRMVILVEWTCWNPAELFSFE